MVWCSHLHKTTLRLNCYQDPYSQTVIYLRSCDWWIFASPVQSPTQYHRVILVWHHRVRLHNPRCTNLDGRAHHTPRLHGIAHGSVGEGNIFPSTLPVLGRDIPVIRDRLTREKQTKVQQHVHLLYTETQETEAETLNTTFSWDKRRCWGWGESVKGGYQGKHSKQK